jgi:hypothetical protein
VGHSSNKRGVSTRAQRNLLIFVVTCGIGMVRIDNDHLCIGTLERLFEVIHHTATSHAVTADHQHQAGVDDARGTVAAQGPGGVIQIDGFVAVFSDDVFQVVCNQGVGTVNYGELTKSDVFYFF